MFEIVVTVITSVSVSVLSGVILALYKDNKRLRQSRKEANMEKEKLNSEREKNKNELLLGVSRIILKNSMDEALRRGYTNQAEYEIINGLYEPYKENGGNGAIEHLYETQYDKLDIK